MSSFGLTLAIAFGLLLICFGGIGLAMIIGKRKRIGACSCSFDADTERARSCCSSHHRNGSECPKQPKQGTG